MILVGTCTTGTVAVAKLRYLELIVQIQRKDTTGMIAGTRYQVPDSRVLPYSFALYEYSKIFTSTGVLQYYNNCVTVYCL